MDQPTGEPGEEWVDDRGWTHGSTADTDVILHHVTAGEPSDPPVVLLHGFPENWWAWRRHIDALAESFRVIAPDMRGYNRSEKPFEVERYHLETLAGDVADLIAERGHDSAHVVGHDWGGVVAFGTALQHPASVDRLVVLNAPYPGAFDDQLTLKQAFRSWYAGLFQLPAVPERLLTTGDFRLLETVFRREPRVPGAYTDEDIRRYKHGWRQEGSIRAMLD